MPLYNAALSVQRSIISVIQQSFVNWELIIINDRSTDNTLRVVEALKLTDKRIKIFTLSKKSGAACARNYGLSIARGRYIAFLDGDDTWHEKKLEFQLEFMKSNKTFFSYTGYSRFSESGRLISKINAVSSTNYHQLLSQNVVPLLTVMIDTKTTGQLSMPELDRQHDYGLWLKLVRNYGNAHGIDQDLASYFVSSSSLSSNKLLAAKDIWTVFRKYENLSILKALNYFIIYTFKGLRYRALEKFIK
jgi:glycosyltransferase involved in cell wall biosynthesis